MVRLWLVSGMFHVERRSGMRNRILLAVAIAGVLIEIYFQATGG